MDHKKKKQNYLLMEIISAIASINAFILAFLISRKKNKEINDKILIAWVLNFAFHFSIPFCIENQLFFHPSCWGFVMGIFIVAHAPFLFVYTSSLSNREFKINFRNFYHFGFVLVFIASIVPFLTLSPDARMNLVQEKQNLSYYILLPMLSLLLIRVYFLSRTIVIVFLHQYHVKQAFSYESKINLN